MSFRPWLDKISANDATNPLTPSYLENRLVAGTGMTLTVNNDGGSETITFASTATGGSYWEPLITGDTDPCEFILTDDFDIIMVEVV